MNNKLKLVLATVLMAVMLFAGVLNMTSLMNATNPADLFFYGFFTILDVWLVKCYLTDALKAIDGIKRDSNK